MKGDILLRLISLDGEAAGRGAPEPELRGGRSDTGMDVPGESLVLRKKPLEERWTAWVNQIDR